MAKLIKQLIILVLIVTALSRGVRQLLPLPVTWAEDEINGQYQYFIDHQDSFNVLFLGSSRIYRSLDPNLFDEVANELVEGRSFKSFNLGAPAYGFPKTELLLTDILENQNHNLDYVFLELAHVSKPVKANSHTPEVIYWHNFQDTSFVLNYWFTHTRFTRSEKVRFSFETFVSFVENKLNIGLGSHILDYFWGNTVPPKLGVNNDGFVSLDTAAIDSAALRKRSEKIQTNPQLVKWMYNNVNSAIARGDEDIEAYNALFVERALKLIKLARDNNVELIFLLSPNVGDDYDVLIPIYNQLPIKNRISRADPLFYPKYYAFENIFDLGHLNAQGAEIFTEDVAKEFSELVSNQNPATLEILQVEKRFEYVDILNKGDSPINLTDWTLYSDRNGRSCKMQGVLNPHHMIRVWSQSVAEDSVKNFNRFRHYACPNQEALWNDKFPAIASVFDSNGVLVANYKESEFQVTITEVNKIDEFLVLQNNGPINQNLDGWTYFSVHNGLSCQLSGNIAPGQSLVVWSVEADRSTRGSENDKWCPLNRPIWNDKFTAHTILLDKAGRSQYEFQD